MAKRVLIGKVVKLIDASTIKVRVENRFRHPIYEKILKSHKSYLVNVSSKSFLGRLGDTVEIAEIPPVSKRKFFELVIKKVV